MNDFDRARAYLAKVPGASGGNRNNATFEAACKVIERFDLSAKDHDELIQDWNRKSNSPPLLDNEVAGCLRSARQCTEFKPDRANGHAAPGSMQKQTTGEPNRGNAPAMPLPTEADLDKTRRLLRDGDSAVARDAREYLLKYGIDPTDCGWGVGHLAAHEAGEFGLAESAAGPRLLVPVYLPDGTLADVRRYRGCFGEGRDSDKLLPWAKGHGSAKPYGWHDLPADAELVVWGEGEKDREALMAAGFPAVSNTCGAGSAAKVARELADELVAGRRFVILFDVDAAGRKGAANLADVLAARGADVAVASWPDMLPDGRVTPDGFDAADMLASFEREALAEIIAGATAYRAAPPGRDGQRAAPRMVSDADMAAASARLAAFVAKVKEATEAKRPDLLTDALSDTELLRAIAQCPAKSAEVFAFAQRLKASMPHGYKACVDSLLEVAHSTAYDEEEGTPPEAKQSRQMLRLAEAAGVEPFRNAGDGTFWLAVPDGNHWHAMPLGEHGGGVSLWLTRLYADAYGGTPPSATAIAEAGRRLASDADRPGCAAHDVHLRIAEHNNRLYLDLGQPDWRVVEIDANGWRVTTCPRGLYFWHGKDFAALPDPDPCGDWQPLLDLLDGWLDTSDSRMIIAWLVAAMQPGRPFHALAIYGEQGSGKTTLAKLLRFLVDPCGPNGVGIVGAPKDEEALTAHALGHHICAFDNLSHLGGDIADCLCRLATGTGVSRRQKYTDYGEALVYVRRPIIVNGIAEITQRLDLLNRFVLVTTLPPADRRTEADLWRAAALARPRVLGAVLDAASAAMRHRAEVTGPLPRMADAGEWLLAAELGEALPWPVGTLASIMAENQKSAQTTAAEASSLTKYLSVLADKAEFAKRNGDKPWRPTATELLDELNDMASDKDKHRKEWPADATRLSAALIRLAPALREAGAVDVQPKKSNGTKWWSISAVDVGAAASKRSDPERPSSDPHESIATLQETPNHAGLSPQGVARAADQTLLPTHLIEKKEGLGADDLPGERVEEQLATATLATLYDPEDPFLVDAACDQHLVDPDEEGEAW